jgi:preprotein translocase subunit SecG
MILIFLVLIQRGKGGGLAGAFGGMGGSSAFGTKAGDVFTKVTMWIALVWILLAMALVLLVNAGRTSAWGPTGSSESTRRSAPAAPSPAKTPGTKELGTGKPTSATPAEKPDVESTLPGTAAPPAEKRPSQPVNPGDPLPPPPPPK